MGRVAGEYTEEDRAVADHRPGFRYTVTDADRARVDDAYRQMCHDLTTAWMNDEQRAQHDARLTTDACPDGVDPRAWAYDQMVRDLTDAWRPDPAKEGAAAPKILPVGAVQKFIGINPGDSCTIDGRRGRWEEGSDGYLYCRPLPLGPPPRADAVPCTMDAAQAQSICDAAYAEYVASVTNAWRS
jgi:hypothetical protein